MQHTARLAVGASALTVPAEGHTTGAHDSCTEFDCLHWRAENHNSDLDRVACESH